MACPTSTTDRRDGREATASGRRSCARGFTLLEAMIAVVLLAIATVSVVGPVKAVARTHVEPATG